MTRSTVLFVYLDRMARVAPAMRTARLGPGPIRHFIVMFLLYQEDPVGPVLGMVRFLRVIPGDAHALSVGYREIVTETLDEICLLPVNPRSELTT